MEDTIQITKAQLAQALTKWDEQALAGNWPPRPELTSAQRGADNAECVWGLLTEIPKSISRDELSGEQLRAAHEARIG